MRTVNKIYKDIQPNKHLYVEYIPPGKDGKFIYCQIVDVEQLDNLVLKVIVGCCYIKRHIPLDASRVIYIYKNMIEEKKVKVYNNVMDGLTDNFINFT